jgi:AraC-like DNA-binding protein
MIEHFNFNDIQNAIRVQQLAMDLLLHVLGDVNRTVSIDYAEQPFKSMMNAYLSFNLSAPLQVESMVRHAGYSESHFSIMFAKAFGAPPH